MMDVAKCETFNWALLFLIKSNKLLPCNQYLILLTFGNLIIYSLIPSDLKIGSKKKKIVFGSVLNNNFRHEKGFSCNRNFDLFLIFVKFRPPALVSISGYPPYACYVNSTDDTQ